MTRTQNVLTQDVFSHLLPWYYAHKQDYPWRKTKNPYCVLISEIMLQQTQVERVIPKYLAWIKTFPDFHTLAQAKTIDVLTHWSGLGYNNRAIRLQTLAKVVVSDFSGELPKDEMLLRKLPGIGPYTAGAIMSFAHDLPGALIDVNVERVLKRTLFDANTIPSKKELEELLYFLQNTLSPRDLGNALMELGQTRCRAKNPSCNSCPLFSHCKNKGERPEESALREKKKQSIFLHSNRWFRGQILKILTQNSKTKKELLDMFENDVRAQKALEQLMSEGLILDSKTLKIRH